MSIQVGDIGTVIEVTVKDQDASAVDLSGGSAWKLLMLSENGVKLHKTMSFTTDGTDGKIRYTTARGDISEAGDWNVQVFVALAAGNWHSDTGTLTVVANLF